jgi:signal transduction histidine kinase
VADALIQATDSSCEVDEPARWLTTIAIVNQRLALGAPIQDTLCFISQEAAYLFGAAATGVWLREGSELVRAASFGTAPAVLLPERLPITKGLPGQVARENRAVFCPPRAMALHDKPGREARTRADEVWGWIGVPLRGRAEVLGVLFAADGAERQFDRTAQRLLEALADQAALAVRLAQRDQDQERHERRLRELAGQLLLSQERERRRLAYDLHDGVAQVAVAVQQHVEVLATRWRPRSPEARTELTLARERARQTVQETRQVIAGLRPTVLSRQGLTAAIRAELEPLRAAGWRVLYQDQLGDERLPAAVETALFRVAQEALANARKHARTNRVKVTLRRETRRVCLEIRDWGCGFQVPENRSEQGAHERVGLAGMQERIGWLNGRFIVRSRPGDGTQIMAEVPLPTRTGGNRHDA